MGHKLAAFSLGAAVLGCASPTRAADVVALRLPADFTVLPEDERRLVSIASDGGVAALAQSTDPIPKVLAVRWSATGVRKTFVPTVRTMSSPGPSPVVPSAVAADRDAVYVTVGEPFSGAYSGIVYTVERWDDELRRRERPTRCAAGENRDGHVYGADGRGQLALTMDQTDSPQIMDDTADAAPYAFVVDTKGCHLRGRAVILNVRGTWASGYRGYIGRTMVKTNYEIQDQHNVAVRWHGAHIAELGDGVAYAVTTDGVTVGATDRVGRPGVSPHAIEWNAIGRRIALETTAARSVAYDVADDGTIVGMLEARDGKHYAFRRARGKLERLDDLPHPPGWRFESAYAIASDGTIVGIGTLHGIATVFRWTR